MQTSLFSTVLARLSRENSYVTGGEESLPPQRKPIGLLRWAGLILLHLFFFVPATTQAQLNVTYGNRGIDQLTYQGIVLEDTGRSTQDVFHIGHMKVTDRKGNVIQQEGWGETNLGTTWDPVAHAMTYRFDWGSIRTQFVQEGSSLDIIVTEVNRADSGMILAGASVYPLTLHFPVLPNGFTDPNYPQGGSDTVAPSILVADFGSAEVVNVIANVTKPLYNMLIPQGGVPTYSVLISSTSPDELATFQPHHDRPVQPGHSDSFRLSLRFAPSGTPTLSLASDAYTNWTQRWPATLSWADRRIIGTAFLASSPQPGVVDPNAASNPRRYFAASGGSTFDLRTQDGLRIFQGRVLQTAEDIVQNLQRMNGQGVITWDIEGEQYPQNTTYVCAPDQIETVAPEMESLIEIPGSPYYGRKLDDTYFSIIKNAGYRIGLCVRPQRFSRDAQDGASQTVLPNAEAEAQMSRKIKYAHDRWGVTLFYLDSTVDNNGAPLNADMMKRLAAAFPDSLLIPEESTPKGYAYTAPFKSFLFNHDLGTDPDVRNYYAHAFSCVLINDAAPSDLAQATPALITGVTAGDLLMIRADYWDNNNSPVVDIYAHAANSSQ